MTDKIDFGGQPWGAMPRSTMRDPRLSHRAKGGLTILLSHEEGWVRSCIAVLQHEGKGGRDQAQSIMKELRELGYATLITERDDEGHVRRHYEIRALPVNSEADSGGFPVDGKPNRRETQRSGNQSIEVEALDVEPLDVEPTAIAPLTEKQELDRRGNDLASAYYDVQPLCNFPSVAGICRKAIKAGYTDQAIQAALLRLAEDGRPVTTGTLHVELVGLPERKTKVPDRGAEILREAFEEGQRAGA